MNEGPTYTAFLGDRQIAHGALTEVASKVRSLAESSAAEAAIFDDATGDMVSADPRYLNRSAFEEALEPSGDAESAATSAQRTRGRPKLGVIAREVTLLPRHWEWLNEQSGGASVALRKLVDEKRKSSEPEHRARKSREAAYKFMSAMAGDRPNFEEAARALFRGQQQSFWSLIDIWPEDIRAHVKVLSAGAFPPGG